MSKHNKKRPAYLEKLPSLPEVLLDTPEAHKSYAEIIALRAEAIKQNKRQPAVSEQRPQSISPMVERVRSSGAIRVDRKANAKFY